MSASNSNFNERKDVKDVKEIKQEQKKMQKEDDKLCFITLPPSLQSLIVKRKAQFPDRWRNKAKEELDAHTTALDAVIIAIKEAKEKEDLENLKLECKSTIEHPALLS